MHLAGVVDVGDVDARAVAAPLHEALFELRGVEAARLRPLQQIGAIGVVVAADVFAPAVEVVPGGLEQQVHRRARHRMHGVIPAVARAAAGVVQVRQVELVDLFGAHQIQQRRQLRVVVLRQRAAQPDLDAVCAAEPDAGQRAVEGPVEPTEAVVRGAQAIERDADVIEAGRGDAPDVVRIDQRAVGRKPQVQAECLGVCGDFVNVGAQQRFAAREDQRRHAEALQVVERCQHLGRRQFAGEVDVGRDRIAVPAGEVAATHEVPDHDRPGRTARRPGGGPGRAQGVQVVADAEHGGSPGRGGYVPGIVTRRPGPALDFRQVLARVRLPRAG